MRIVTGEVRLSYAKIWHKEKSLDGGKEKYSTAILIPKTDKVTVDKIKNAVETIKKETPYLKKGTCRAPLRDGDTEREEELYKGHYFLNARTERKPQIIDIRGEDILDENEVYSGCYCRVSLTFYAYNWNGNTGVGVGLGNIQKIRDGERLGDYTSAQEDFGIEVLDRGVREDSEDLPF